MGAGSKEPLGAGAAYLTKIRTTLTKRQQQCLDFIVDSTTEHGRPPSIREIGESLGIRSTNGVVDHLRALEKKGAILRSDDISRGIRVVGMTAPVHKISTLDIVVDRTSMATAVATLEALSDWVPGPMKDKFEGAVSELKVLLMGGRVFDAESGESTNAL